MAQPFRIWIWPIILSRAPVSRCIQWLGCSLWTVICVCRLCIGRVIIPPSHGNSNELYFIENIKVLQKYQQCRRTHCKSASTFMCKNFKKIADENLKQNWYQSICLFVEMMSHGVIGCSKLTFIISLLWNLRSSFGANLFCLVIFSTTLVIFWTTYCRPFAINEVWSNNLLQTCWRNQICYLIQFIWRTSLHLNLTWNNQLYK